jgi:hypothetical protein
MSAPDDTIARTSSRFPSLEDFISGLYDEHEKIPTEKKVRNTSLPQNDF